VIVPINMDELYFVVYVITPYKYIGYVTSKDDSEWSGNLWKGAIVTYLNLLF
jgi:hypothetical protein